MASPSCNDQSRPAKDKGQRTRDNKGRPVTTDSRSRRRNGELKPVTAYVEKSLWKALRVYAVQHDVLMSHLVSDAIETHLKALAKIKESA